MRFLRTSCRVERAELSWWTCFCGNDGKTSSCWNLSSVGKALLHYCCCTVVLLLRVLLLYSVVSGCLVCHIITTALFWLQMEIFNIDLFSYSTTWGRHGGVTPERSCPSYLYSWCNVDTPVHPLVKQQCLSCWYKRRQQSHLSFPFAIDAPLLLYGCR